MCHALRPAADAVDSPNSEGIRELFCSTSCVMASKVQTGSSSGTVITFATQPSVFNCSEAQIQVLESEYEYQY